jgi:non-specific protein-tyrosine kinase
MDLRQYINIGLKWWWLLLLLAVTGTGVGYGLAIRQAPVYQAFTTIMVGQSIQSAQVSSGDLWLSEQLARTYAEIAKQQIVMQKVIDTLQLPDSWQALSGRVTLATVRDTQLLQITAEAGSPEAARDIADEVANQLILLSPTNLQAREQTETERFVQQRIAELQGKIEAGQSRLTSLQEQLNQPLSVEQASEVQAEIDNLETLINEWESNHTQLLTINGDEKTPNFLAIIQPAEANPTPVRPRPTRNGLLGGVASLLVAAGIAFLIEYLDDRIKSPEDLSQALGLTSLGVITYIKGKERADRLVAAHDVFSPVAEAYRMIRSNIQFMAVDRPLKRIVITSAAPEEGKSTTVANLGIVLAQAGFRTVIVDADLRRPTQHEIFQVPENSLLHGGLTELICTAQAQPAHYVRKTGIANLGLITSGNLPPNPSELLGSRRMRQVLESLSAVVDIVLIDSPPAALVTDAVVLSTQSDGVILVTWANQTKLGVARQALLNFQQANAPLLGAVLNRVTSKRSGYYYYNYYGHSQPRRPTVNGTASKAQAETKETSTSWLPFSLK